MSLYDENHPLNRGFGPQIHYIEQALLSFNLEFWRNKGILVSGYFITVREKAYRIIARLNEDYPETVLSFNEINYDINVKRK